MQRRWKLESTSSSMDGPTVTVTRDRGVTGMVSRPWRRLDWGAQARTGSGEERGSQAKSILTADIPPFSQHLKLARGKENKVGLHGRKR